MGDTQPQNVGCFPLQFHVDIKQYGGIEWSPMAYLHLFPLQFGQRFEPKRQRNINLWHSGIACPLDFQSSGTIYHFVDEPGQEPPYSVLVRGGCRQMRCQQVGCWLLTSGVMGKCCSCYPEKRVKMQSRLLFPKILTSEGPPAITGALVRGAN